MKKILTVLTAVLLLCATLFSMTSCFGVNMDDLKEELYDMDAKDENMTVQYYETATKTVIKRYVITMMVGTTAETLTVTEYASKKLAKLEEKEYDLSKKFAKKYYALQEDIYEEKKDLGEDVEEFDADKEYDEEYKENVFKRKGAVIISGSKFVYKKVF